MNKQYDSKLTAAALLFKLKNYCKELEAKESPTDSEKRHLITIKAGSLCLEDRIHRQMAKILNSRA